MRKIKMKKIICIFFCFLFVFNSFYISLAAKGVNEKPGEIKISLGDGKINRYEVLLRDNELYMSADNLALITNYRYCFDHVLVLERGTANWMENIYVGLDGKVETMGKKYHIDIIKKEDTFYLPLEKMLYLMHATWCVEKNVVYINAEKDTLFDVIFSYWDEIAIQKNDSTNLLLNGENGLLRAFRSSLVYMIRDFDVRMYIPFLGTDSLMIEEYEKALMSLLENDEQFLTENDKQKIEEMLNKSEFKSMADRGKILQEFIKIPKEMDFEDQFIDEYLSQNNVAAKISSDVDFSEVKKIQLEEISDILKKMDNAASAVKMLNNAVEMASWAGKMDQEFLEEMKIIEKIDWGKEKNSRQDKIKKAASNLVKKKSDPHIFQNKMSEEVIKFFGEKLAEITFTGKAIGAIQLMDSFLQLTNTGVAKAMDVAELSHTIYLYVCLEQFLIIEENKIFDKIIMKKEVTEENIKMIRRLMMLDVRLHLRGGSFIYQLNKMGNDIDNWEETREAEQMRESILNDYMISMILTETEKMDKRLILDDFRHIYNEEEGEVREKINVRVFHGKDNSLENSISNENQEKGFALYQKSYQKMINQGNWNEKMQMDMDIRLQKDGTKANTKGSINSDLEVRNYTKDMSQINISGKINYNIMNMNYEFNVSYDDENMYYQMLKPEQQEYKYNMQMQPYYYLSLSEEDVKDVMIKGKQIIFTIKKEAMEERTDMIFNLVQNIKEVKYGDIFVTATLSDMDDTLQNIEMNFDAQALYGGYQSTIHYEIDYSFFPLREQ